MRFQVIRGICTLHYAILSFKQYFECVAVEVGKVVLHHPLSLFYVLVGQEISLPLGDDLLLITAVV